MRLLKNHVKVGEAESGWQQKREAEMASIKETLAKIAAEKLDVETLETRKSDSLDFHDGIAVWQIEEALRAAYAAGARQAYADTARNNQNTGE